MAVYEHTLVCRCLKVNASSSREKNPWVGTTGAGQNCPERESESPGEDVIFDDWVLVLGSNSLFYFFVFKFDSRSFSPLPEHLWYAQRHSGCASPIHRNSLSVSQDIHLLLCSVALRMHNVLTKHAWCQKENKETSSSGIWGARLAPDKLAEAVVAPVIHGSVQSRRIDNCASQFRKKTSSQAAACGELQMPNIHRVLASSCLFSLHRPTPERKHGSKDARNWTAHKYGHGSKKHIYIYSYIKTRLYLYIYTYVYIYTYIYTCRFFPNEVRYHENAAQKAIVGRGSLLHENSSRFCLEYLDVESPTTSTTTTIITATKAMINYFAWQGVTKAAAG